MTEVISEREIFKYLEDHPARSFTIKTMNEDLGYNEVSLSRKMRQLYFRGKVARDRMDNDKENGRSVNAFYYSVKR